MSTGYNQQALSYDVRLPDDAQADALRLLNAVRTVINMALSDLWPHLSAFAGDRSGPAWKQVVEMIPSPSPHGNRNWRCEAEVVGRTLRAQAERKQVFERIQPILTDGFIRPKTEKSKPGKNRHTIKTAINDFLKQMNTEGEEESFALVQNVVEQCCNFFLKEGQFPRSYEELQPVPLLKVGMLTFAGDDGPYQ
jgi:putative transposase